MNNKIAAGIAMLAGVIFLIIGYVYATHSAGSLPSFFPGYLAGESHIHSKHSIAAFVVGVLCFVYAWFQTGPKQTI